ncbi:SDR family NAD(P)-dependent oxidoreductase [Chloroflexota bacterium]
MTMRDRPDASSLFLVSGGAKGITAQCIIKLAERYRCKFVLVGRSSIAEPEPVWARGGSDEAELKRRAMEDRISKGERPKPKDVHKTVKAILSRREIERTLRAIEQMGGQAEYLSADVTDGPDLQAKLQVVSQRLGPITGIIHGAGTLADKLIENKSEQDFEMVYSPKVKGLENLLDCVPASQLDYLILFSSVAAFHGNVGQSDYAIANEILNKSAYLVKRSQPSCHVVSINWGPWDAGMVTPELKKAFAQRGVKVIPIEVGTRMFVDELTAADQAPQIVIGSPLVAVAREPDSELRTFRVRRRLTLEANPFLQDHVIGGHAVLPTVCAIAWIANACEQLYPGYRFFSSEGYKALKGIVFDETLASEYILDLKEIAKTDASEIVFEATVWSRTESGKARYHYSARVRLLRQIPAAPTYTPLDGTSIGEEGGQTISGASLYHNGTLFHGPCFRGVERVLDISPQKLTMRCVLPKIETRLQGQFPVQAFNPYVADAQFQCMVIWAWHFRQAGSLPLRAQKGEQFQEIPFDQAFYVSMEVQSSTENCLVADIIVHDAQGQICARVSGAEVTISERLNPLFRQNHLL